MAKLKTSTVEKVINVLKSEEYYSCSEIAKYIQEICGEPISGETVKNINTGKSYYQESIDYPVSAKYTRAAIKYCSVCGKPSIAKVQGQEYCRKHYIQMTRHGHILTETIYDRNEYIEHEDYVEIILKNKDFQEVARTLIDIEDKDKVLKYKWYCHQYENNKKYCQGTLEEGLKVRLHHFILGIEKNTLKGYVVDHINGDSLDNRKNNLRIVSQTENMQNIKPNDPMKWIKFYTLKDGSPRYSARISVNYKDISLGTYDTLEEAQKARREAEEYYKSQK